MNIELIRNRKIPIFYWAVLIYDWMLEKATHRYSLFILVLICFCEGIFFPIPPDVMLLPMMLASPKRSFFIATIATIASVLGGVVGYLIGWSFYDLIALPLLSAYGYQDFYQTFSRLFLQHDHWVVFAGGFSPIPYKVISVSAGFAGMNLLAFIAISILARGCRFFLLAVLIRLFGANIRTFIDKYFGLLSLLFCLLLLIGILTLRYIH